MTEKFTNVNGIKLCYEIKGEGEPLILVHGFGVTKEVWIAQFEPLAEYFKVIRFDNRGAGKSDRPNEPYRMEMFADDIAGLMDNLEINKAHILGWSLGGMIVQTFALKYPNRINKIVLINTLPQWPGDKSGLQMYEIEQSITNPSRPQDIRNQTHALGAYDVLDDLHKIEILTLIICAEKDRQTPKIMNEKIHEKIPNSKLIVIENAGHDSPKERAPEVNQHIIDFLKK
ncbi:MAG: alpha/beta hydrolase [Candidatus Lokiarchaeota archaeon]